VSIENPDLAVHLAVAEAVTGIEADVLIRSTKLDLADSALHAPQGAWGAQEFYPDSLTRRVSSSCVSPRTTPFWTATSGLRG